MSSELDMLEQELLEQYEEWLEGLEIMEENYD